MAPEDGEIVCLKPAQLEGIKRLATQRAAPAFTLLQGRDGTLFLLLEVGAVEVCSRLTAVEDLTPAAAAPARSSRPASS